MISLLEINEAINDKIKNALANSDFKVVPIVASDLKEPITRPSIKTVFDGTTRKMNSRMKERTLTCRVYFFASDLRKYKIENTKVQNLIENEFLTPIKVTDTFYIDVDDVDSTVSDTVLICSFDIQTLEDIPDEILDDGVEYENMENLNLELED
ncbi:DUF6838 family protein [Clostridium sp. BJN0001]|uniref:phage tail terminator family protein n=1 Tax=Clostridium sp. BJN0001 TaxID=2930219 RepID=UPI001FD03826|nr:hypothetical protein [Clostridium sp. BJN0001]